MNKQKGFITTGIIIAIIALLAIIGGIIYKAGQKNAPVPVEVQTNNGNQTNTNNAGSSTIQFSVVNTTPENSTQPVPNDCASKSRPSIKIISPKGGEVFQTGGTMPIKWFACNIPTTDRFVFQIYGEGYKSMILGFKTGLELSGIDSAVFTIPADTTPGNVYLLSVGDQNPDSASMQLTDQTNNVFSVVR